MAARKSTKADSDDEAATSEVLNKVGLDVRELTPALRRDYKLGTKATGLLVTSVESGSIAEEAGVRKGDLLVQVNKRNVKTLADLAKAVTPNKPIVVMIKRDSQTFILGLKPERDGD